MWKLPKICPFSVNPSRIFANCKKNNYLCKQNAIKYDIIHYKRNAIQIMKKSLKLMMVVLLTAIGLSLTSCGDDEKDYNSIVGEWRPVPYGQNFEGGQYLRFEDNGQFSWVNHVYDVVDGRVDEYYERVKGNYTLTGYILEGAILNLEGVDDDGDELSTTLHVQIVNDGMELLMTDEDGETIRWYRSE